MRGLFTRYRRLSWFVHILVILHVLALSCIPAYYVLRWYGPRQIAKNMVRPVPTSWSDVDQVAQMFEFDRLEFGGEGWITFWYRGGVMGHGSYSAWQLRYPFRYASAKKFPGRTEWTIIDSGKRSTRAEEGDHTLSEIFR